MARSTVTQPVNTFIAGLITEATELTQPKNSSTDEDNCLLLNEGNRTRRRGVDFEPGAQLSALTTSETDMESYAVETFTWTSVAGNGSRNFAVVQIGDELNFYDIGEGDTLSDNLLPFSVDLNALSAPAFTDVTDVQLEFDSGNGFLFCAGSKTIPFVVEYDPDANNITVIPVTVEIRDFAGLDDGLEFEEEPSALSNEHQYNLENQGWFVQKDGQNPITRYQSSAGVYPPNSLQWFAAKTSGGLVDTGQLRRLAIGNTLAPRGHYIVDAFNIDRSAVSGIGGIPNESVDARPKAVAFFAGRVWWAGVDGPGLNGNLYFSQVLQNINQAGRCYQIGDPTSEEDPVLVDSDGGVVTIQEIGSVQKLLPLGASLIVFADNGVWRISGPDDVFKATNFSVRKITTQGVINGKTVVDSAGIPIWWGEAGIFSLVADEVSLEFSALSLSENTIERFYQDIPAESRATAKGVYDQVAKKVVWLYRDTAPVGVNRFQYNRCLWLDTNIRAFYPWSVGSLATDSPYVASVFETPELNIGSIVENVIVTSNDLVIDSALEEVVANTGSILRTSSSLRFLAIVPDGALNTNYTFCDFNNSSLVDWEAQDATGVEYSSFAETWYELNDDVIRYIQAPFLYVHCRRTETAFIPDGGGGFVFDNPSSLIVRAKWDWTDDESANRWSRPFQAYRFKRPPVVDPGDLSFNNGYPLTITRNKIRGKGRTLQLRFESEGTNDFNLVGWAVIHEGNNAV